MAKEVTVTSGSSATVSAGEATIVIRVDPRPPRRWFRRVGLVLLCVSLLMNVWFLVDPLGYVRPGIPEQHFSGVEGSANRIAIINFEGTISPPFTERWLRQIKQAAKDESVKGVILSIDSPGGFVADSHQLYREIQKLSKDKPVYVSMKRIAASGGYYIAMAPGEKVRIFAEPTTWTGSIGVIIARYNARELAEKIGVKVEPLVTGPLKDTLNPFRDMTERETQVWDAILKDAFDRFVGIVDAGRPQLDDAAVRALATGQVYTAQQALDNHLVDQLGYVEDALAAMAEELKLGSDYEAFEYRSTPGLVDALIGAAVDTPDMTSQFLDAASPKAMYYASWNPWIPASPR